MAILSLLFGAVGCNKSTRAPKHTLSDITAVSIACGHMDRSYGYSFGIYKQQESWLFDAECFTHNNEIETTFEKCVIEAEDVDELFEILERNDSVSYAEAYKPKANSSNTADAEIYSFGLTFSDSTQCTTDDEQPELCRYFYRLAEKYEKTNSDKSDNKTETEN